MEGMRGARRVSWVWRNKENERRTREARERRIEGNGRRKKKKGKQKKDMEEKYGKVCAWDKRKR